MPKQDLLLEENHSARFNQDDYENLDFAGTNGYDQTINMDDKLWASISYLLPIFAIIALRNKDKRDRPFIKYHAVQAIAFSIVLLLLILFITIVTFLFGSISSLIWFAMLWPAYDAYKGNYTKIPYVTKYILKRGWV